MIILLSNITNYSTVIYRGRAYAAKFVERKPVTLKMIESNKPIDLSKLVEIDIQLEQGKCQTNKNIAICL